MCRFAVALAFCSLIVSPVDAASQAASSLQQRFERLAAETSHFATDDIVRNRWSDGRRWPVGLLEEQQEVLGELRSAGDQRQAVVGLLQHRNPKVRTLALGALFVREDPRDLSLIASLVSDGAETLPRLEMSPTSMAGRLPLSYFESSQSVGDVARTMIGFYLAATFKLSGFGRSISGNDVKDFPPATFERYWAEHKDRAECASWFLVKMRRATRDTSPLLPEYEADVRRVLAEIDALPLPDRVWTLLYVREDQSQIDTILSAAAMVAALTSAGPSALMKVLRREPVSDDPDLLAPMPERDSWLEPHWRAVQFILAHAPELLRPSDADGVLAAAEAYRGPQLGWEIPEWIAASARLRGLENPERAAQWLKDEIRRIPLSRTLGPRDQPHWRSRCGKCAASPSVRI